MHKTIFTYLILFLLFSHGLTAAEDRYVVVLSMDGFRADYPDMAHTPTLDSLAFVGVRSVFRPAFPANTFPNHYSMATGLYPDHHGIINNYFYSATHQKVFNIRDSITVRDASFYGGEPIWVTAEKQGVRTGVYHWAGSETGVGGVKPTLCVNYKKEVTFRTKAEHVVNWLCLPEEERPRLIMWYLEEPDLTAHKAAPQSRETVDMVELLDELLHDFFSQIRQLDYADRIDFIIVSDHGMGPVDPVKWVNLQEYLPRDSFEYIFGGNPTFLYPKPGYTEKAMAILNTIPHIKARRKADMPAAYRYGTHPDIAEIIVLPDNGAYLQFAETTTPRTGGAHGYDNNSPDMQAIFYAAGPSFQSGITHPAMDNIHLYLILCRLLQLEPAPDDGHPEVISSLFR